MIIPIEKKTLDILKEYNGNNDYILGIQKEYFNFRSFMPTKKQSEYIIKNGHVNSIVINKVVEIHKSCSAFVQEQLRLDYPPEKIFIYKLLSRKGDLLHIYGSIDSTAKKFEYLYLSKTCIRAFKELPVIDYTKYDRQPLPHQILAIEKLITNSKFILADDMGLAKMEFVDNKLFTPNGRVRIGDIRVGNEVIGSDGTPYKVKGVFPKGIKDLYRITFNDGYSILVGKDHLWNVSPVNSGENNTNRYVTLSTEQMLDQTLKLKQNGIGWNEKKPYNFSTYYKYKNGDYKWQIPIAKPISFSNNYNLPIDPYLLGLILGDGCIKKKSVSFRIHKDDIDEMLNGIEIRQIKSKRPDINACTIGFNNDLIDLKINDTRSWNKFIPDIYKYSSINDRLKLIQGLMDTDRCRIKLKNGNFSGTQYTTISEQLADDVAEIIHSLGGIARKSKRVGSYKKNGIKHICRISYNLNIKMPSEFNPFMLKRKADLYNTPKKYKIGRYIKDIKLECQGEAVCISVDSPDQLYVTEHAIVTHNTSSSIIAALESKFQRILVVCPASLKLNWEREISYYDNPENISIIDSINFKTNKWVIVNYDILKNFHYLPERGVKISELPISPIDAYNFDLVIVDEAHYLKDAQSQRSKIFMDFASRISNRWLLTGTPIPNKTIDFYNLLNICESPIALNWSHFVRHYCAGKQFYRKGTKQKYWVTSGSSNLDELREYSSDIMLRRLKKDSIELPQKTVKPIYLPLEASIGYNSYLKEYKDWVEAQDEKPKISDHLTKLIKVRQLLSYDKIAHTIKLAEDYIESGQKIIIFSCFTQTIHAIHEHFGKTSVIIDGSVSKEKRQKAVDSFQTDNKIKVFCGNIIAAGVGLTLTEGTVVIFNDLDWVPTNHAQSEDRCYRYGQEKPVHIIYLLIDETLDLLMYKSLKNKMAVITKIIGDNLDEENLSVAKEVISEL